MICGWSRRKVEKPVLKRIRDLTTVDGCQLIGVGRGAGELAAVSVRSRDLVNPGCAPDSMALGLVSTGIGRLRALEFVVSTSRR